MVMKKEVELPRPTVRPGTLLSVASRLSADAFVVNGVDRMALGVRYIPWGCGDLQILADGCSVDLEKDDTPTLPEWEERDAFLVADALSCNTLSGVDRMLAERVASRLFTRVSAAFASELMTGAASGNPGLGDVAVTLSGGPELAEVALGVIEAGLADALQNEVGLIHVPAGALPTLVANAGLRWAGDFWVSPSGHPIVVDAGYGNGFAPSAGGSGDSPTPAAAGSYWIYGSGPVWYGVTDISLLEPGLNLSRNMLHRIGERYGVVLFDPCAVVTAETLGADGPGSGA